MHEIYRLIFLSHLNRMAVPVICLCFIPILQLMKLYVSDMNGCLDTAIQHVKIYKPDADFMVNDSTGCGNFTAQFTDLTQTDTTLSSWYWSFGNGTYSDEQHPLASYNSTGNFTVNMIVSDILGCSDTINKLNYIHSSSPNAIF